MSTVLRTLGLQVAYGSALAVRGVDLEVNDGHIVALLGANGAGKSSIIKAILGLVKPRAGKIDFLTQKDIQGLAPHKVNQMGIAWVPEGRMVFSSLSVYENLLMGAFNVKGTQEVKRRVEYVTNIFPLLDERRQQLAGSLSGGEQQMLAIGRALMSNARLLLMDEPSLGLSPLLIRNLFGTLKQIRNDGISILMAEQNARQSLKVADYVYLLQMGKIRAEGVPEEMEDREDVRRTYLGG